MATKQLTLPITGMTCANCAATIERNLKKLPTAINVNVNLASERATLEFDPAALTREDIMARIEKAGYGVAVAEAVLPIKRMSDDNDARRLERVLSRLDGVISAAVTFASEKATVKYIPTLVSQGDLRSAVGAAGFEAVVSEGNAEDAERLAREKEINHQKHLLTVGLILTIPLFALSMARDLGVLPSFFLDQTHAGMAGMAREAVWWFNWLLFALATPVQFYVGWQYYVGGYKALRNGSANMDVLIALGSSAAYFYSLPILFGWLKGHVYFETAAVIVVIARRVHQDPDPRLQVADPVQDVPEKVIPYLPQGVSHDPPPGPRGLLSLLLMMRRSGRPSQRRPLPGGCSPGIRRPVRIPCSP